MEISAIPERHLWQQWIFYFIITLLTELAVCAVWFPGETYTRKLLLCVLIVNIISQPVLFFTAFYLNIHNSSFPINFVGELLVIVAEFSAFVFFVKELFAAKALLFSTVINLASIIVGAILASTFNI
jgi:hypothetical protein